MKNLKGGEWQYRITDFLGKGAFGEVFKAQNTKTGEIAAVKVIPLANIDRNNGKLRKAIEQEKNSLKVASASQNPYILQMIDAFESSNNCYIFTEFCDGGSFQDIMNAKNKKLETFTEEEGLSYLYQVVLALVALGDQKLVHRDLKPDNIFMSKGICKLGDFGFVRMVVGEFHTECGTPVYMAPEFFNDAPLTDKVDIFAFGVMAHQVLIGGFPNGKIEVPPKTQFRAPKNSHLSPQSLNMIEACLQHKAAFRIDIASLKFHQCFRTVSKKYDVKLKPEVFQSMFVKEDEIVPLKPSEKQDADYIPYDDFVDKKKVENNAVRDQEKKHSINKTFEQINAHRNIAKFLYSNSNYLVEYETALAFSSYVMAKRVVQMFSNIKYFLDLKKMPDISELPMECSAANWKDFCESDLYSGFVDTIVADIYSARRLFNKTYQNALKLYKDKQDRMAALISSNMNQSLKHMMQTTMSNCVKHLLDKYKRKKLKKCLDVGIYLSLIESFMEEPKNFMKAANLKEFIHQVSKFEADEQVTYLENYVEKYKIKIDKGMHDRHGRK